MTTITANLHQQLQRIRGACLQHGRPPDSVRLLAVSKTFDAQAVVEAALAGQRAFGENYIQEGVAKIQALREAARDHLALADLEWHCIGPVQANKTRLVAEYFDWVHTIDRLKIAQRLSEQRPAHLPPLQVCIQVNVDGGTNKSGVAPADLPGLAHAVSELPRLVLRGLMCIPEPASDFEASMAPLKSAKTLFDALKEEGLPLDTLSMGMSDDAEAAIATGSTMVRVGRGVFGFRALKPGP